MKVAMESEKVTEVEDLIRQAQAVLKDWNKSQLQGTLSERTWQELLDDKPYPHLRIGKL